MKPHFDYGLNTSLLVLVIILITSCSIVRPLPTATSFRQATTDSAANQLKISKTRDNGQDMNRVEVISGKVHIPTFGEMLKPNKSGFSLKIIEGGNVALGDEIEAAHIFLVNDLA